MADRPDWRTEIRRRIEPLGLTPTREAEIVEEVAQHLDDRYRELRAAGRSEDAARAAAWQELEDKDVLRREVGRLEYPAPVDLPPLGAPRRRSWLSGLGQDLRHALRTMRRSPGFTATVLFALALSIGPTSAILSLGNWLVWRPHPGVADPDRLGVMWLGVWRDEGLRVRSLTYEHLAMVSSQSRLASGITGVQELYASLSIPGILPRRTATAHVTGNFFDVLGVRLRAGRGFLPEEDRGFGVPVAVIGEGLARSLFGTPENALQRVILLNSRSFTVVGVAPSAFRGIALNDVSVWVPGAAYGFLNHGAIQTRFYSFVVRLAPDARFETLAAELNVILNRLSEADPGNARLKGIEARVFSGLGIEPLMRPRIRATVNMMSAIGAVLLMLGCANVANLLVFRSSRRHQEILVRKALGASRARLVQANVMEGWVLAIAGAALGLLLAFFLKDLMQHLLFPRRLLPAVDVPMDRRVLLGTLVTALVTGLIAAAAPAWFAVRNGTATIAHAGTRTSTRAPKLRGGLAALQLALSLTLLVGALLLVTTLRNLRAVEMGFTPDDVTAMSVTLDSHGYRPPQQLQYFREVLTAMEAHGEYASVALAYAAVGSSLSLNVRRPDGGEESLEVGTNGISDRYFETLSIPIRRGRAFNREEVFASSGAPPVIVSESLARLLYGTTDVVGNTIRIAWRFSQWQEPLTIVGVSGDVVTGDLTGVPRPMLYEPIGRYEMPVGSGSFLIRSALTAAKAGAAANAIASRTDSSVPVSNVRPLTADVDSGLAQQRLFAWILSLLAAIGFVLAPLGLYGLVSQTTGERSREFGIRVAIGASRGAIIRLVARYALAVSSGGVVAGLMLSLFGSQFVESMLFGVSRLDPMVYIAAVTTLVAVVVLACIAPALRALRVQPVEVLRAE